MSTGEQVRPTKYRSDRPRVLRDYVNRLLHVCSNISRGGRTIKTNNRLKRFPVFKTFPSVVLRARDKTKSFVPSLARTCRICKRNVRHTSSYVSFAKQSTTTSSAARPFLFPYTRVSVKRLLCSFERNGALSSLLIRRDVYTRGVLRRVAKTFRP